MSSAIAFNRDDVVLAMVPLCHSYGLEHGLLAPLYAGSRVRLAAGFDLTLTIRELQAGNVSVLPTVPSVYEMLSNLATPGTVFPTLRAAYSAGGPLPARIYEKFADDHGLRVSQLYGATEIGSITYSHADEAHFQPSSVGRAMEGVELRVDSSDNQLYVRARSMFSGYVGHENALRDGFFPTGDLARIDSHGNLFITGRLKLLIDVGGMKVNPIEVEDVLSEHPDVGDCVVVGVRQSDTISRIKAVVTPRDPARPVNPEDVRSFARTRLAAQKMPRVIEVRNALPRSATGKILRHLVDP
jgi:acyl-CoA synthetase (AMP-forming)/AMP-acid ligase II